MGSKVPSQSLQRVPHASQLTTDLPDPLAHSRLSISELGDLGAEAISELGDLGAEAISDLGDLGRTWVIFSPILS